MLGSSHFMIRALAIVTRGAALHRSALEALGARRFATAEFMFEAAAGRYRSEMAVEALARLRVHQLMAQVLSGAEPARAAERCLEVERRLCQLDQIESLAAPHELVDAHSVLGSWLNRDGAAGMDPFENVPLSRAA